MRKLIFIIVIISTSVNALELTKSISGRYDEGQRTPQQKESIIKLIDTYKAANDYQRGMLGFIQIDSSDIWYSLNRDLRIQGSNISTKQYLGSWSITRWPYEYIVPELTARLEPKGYGYEMEPTPQVTQLIEPDKAYNGCLSQTPLRYGDVDGNGSQELVILANQDIIFFSPAQKKVIFQLRWIDERYGGYYDENDEPIELKDPKYPQYEDPYSHGSLYKGLRSYAKMYLGEFNGNQTPDIVVWYKVYQSNMNGDTPGFSKIHDIVRHFELIAGPVDGQEPTGEYLPMSTPEDTIRQWLSAKNLTWQKGYPNLSECAGQTDKHIPGMVDPLLNDPDVLK